MAAKIDAGEVGRSDLFFVYPENIIIDRNSRWKQFDEAHVEALVKSFEVEGQLQPVEVRKVQGNKVQLVMGFNRHEAARRYNERHPGKRMKLKCVVVNCNEEEAFRRSIEENRVRLSTSPMDDAHAQRELRDRFGWTDVRIAELYHKTTAHISLLRKLLSLSKETQEKVDSGELAVDAACALSALPEKEQREVMKTAPVGVAKASLSQKVRSGVREKRIARGEKQPRTSSEIRTYFHTLESDNATVTAVGGLMLQFLSGSISDKQMTSMLENLV